MKNNPFYKNYNLPYDTFPFDEIKTEHVKQAAIAAKLTHQPDRHKAYPHVRDQLDMLYKDIDSGKLDKTGDWYKAIKKVKDDIPKPE